MHERYQGGSPKAEQILFERLALDIMQVQMRQRRRSGAERIDRAFHAKTLLATSKARLVFINHLGQDLQQGLARPNASYEAIVRISNASGLHQADTQPDLRGIALRVKASDNRSLDFLLTNAAASHARDAKQFVAVALAEAQSRFKLTRFIRLLASVGLPETLRIGRTLKRQLSRPRRSIAEESFWSRGAMLWGSAGPVRLVLQPPSIETPAVKNSHEEPRDLRQDIVDRLAKADVIYELHLQPFLDEKRTPIEDASVDWSAAGSRPVLVARLIIPRQDVDTAAARDAAHRIDQLTFNPWHTSKDFRPLGNLNRARKSAYQASAAHRHQHRFYTHTPWYRRAAMAVFIRGFQAWNRFRPWYRMCFVGMQLWNLMIIRHQLREKNLIDPLPEEHAPVPFQPPLALPEEARKYRSYDGTNNDLSAPCMGAVKFAFGRNLPPGPAIGQSLDPNPVEIGEALLRRKTFVPATTLNILAAAWIQFQVHDWVQHDHYSRTHKPIRVPIPDPDALRWKNTVNATEDAKEMVFRADRPIPGQTAAAANGPVHTNQVSHWWDASEVYGSNTDLACSLRSRIGGLPDREDKDPGTICQKSAKLDLPDGLLPLCDGQENAGFNQSWWLGLSAIQTLFAREHNAVCEALKEEYGRHWDEERIYQTARLVVSALIAKIHTIEWTPAILATDALRYAMNANWSGPGPRDFLFNTALRFMGGHARYGIPETKPVHHGVPYALTEEFVSVYRMHPLIPDDYTFHDHKTGTRLDTLQFSEIHGDKTDNQMRRLSIDNVFYSLGIAHPGAITLHNYPNALMRFNVRDKDIINLAVVDIVRDRIRAVPRYNAFRKGLHMPPIRRWEDLTANPESAAILKKLYKDIDRVDTMVGLLAETPPPGFGFSDTAFRIFILMASRRLQSDRFLTVDFRPEVYSPLGYKWVQENDMTSVILRHFPQLAAVLPREQSAFAPWRAI